MWSFPSPRRSQGGGGPDTILLKVQNVNAASWAILELSAIEPDLEAARRGTEAVRADRLTIAGKVEEAVTMLNGLIEKHADSHRLFAARARAYQSLERWNEAVADWSRALELQQDDREYLFERATIYTRHLKQHRPHWPTGTGSISSDRARCPSRGPSRTRPKGPDDPAFRFLAALAHHRAGNADRAKELLSGAATGSRRKKRKRPARRFRPTRIGVNGPCTRACSARP